MNKVDRQKLLFGPYKAPALRVGDHAVCLARDGDVIVTSWTNARFSWPRCRAIGKHAGSGLLLDEELARAVRQESALAIMYWWGASHGTVTWWRRVLGVNRIECEGTHRLIQANAEQGAELLRGQKLPEERVERQREIVVEHDLGRNLILGYHGPRWTKKELALLGTAPDEDIAERIGKTAEAVRVMRVRRRIANPVSNGWTAEELALLGVLTDEEVAARIGRTVRAVMLKRCKLRILKPSGRPRKENPS